MHYAVCMCTNEHAHCQILSPAECFAQVHSHNCLQCDPTALVLSCSRLDRAQAAVPAADRVWCSGLLIAASMRCVRGRTVPLACNVDLTAADSAAMLPAAAT